MRVVLCLLLMLVAGPAYAEEQSAFQKRMAEARTSAPAAESSSGFASTASEVMKGLIVVVGAILLASSLYKRFAKPNLQSSGEQIVISGKKQLTGRSTLIIAEVGGERMLLAQVGEDVRFLTTLSERELFGSVDGHEIAHLVGGKLRQNA